MKVKMLRTPGRKLLIAISGKCSLREGQEGNLGDDVAQSLIDRGLAVAVGKPEPRQPVKAVSPQPKVAKSEEPKVKAE